jgi:hypothetical protein
MTTDEMTDQEIVAIHLTMEMARTGRKVENDTIKTGTSRETTVLTANRKSNQEQPVNPQANHTNS